MSFSMEILLRFLLMIEKLQESLMMLVINSVFNGTWSIRNTMAFNVKKCKVMRLTKNRQPLVSNYSLDNSLLEELKEFKDLEVTTTHNFKGPLSARMHRGRLFLF